MMPRAVAAIQARLTPGIKPSASRTNTPKGSRNSRCRRYLICGIVAVFGRCYTLAMKKGILVFWGILILLIVLGVLSSFMISARPNKLDSFAQCLKTSGSIFYGALWCPHCQRTKALFGSAAQYLPYVECSTPDGQGRTQICIDKKIEQYPTWVFPDGSILTGEHSLQELSTASKCSLPA